MQPDSTLLLKLKAKKKEKRRHRLFQEILTQFLKVIQTQFYAPTEFNFMKQKERASAPGW